MERTAQWLKWEHGVPCNASQTPATPPTTPCGLPALSCCQAGSAEDTAPHLHERSSLLPLGLLPTYHSSPSFHHLNGFTLAFQSAVITFSCPPSETSWGQSCVPSLLSSPALWLSCKKPVGCCTWSRTVNIPFITEGGIFCKGQRRQQPQGKKCSFSLPPCCCLLKMFAQASFTLCPLPLFLINLQFLCGFFPSMLIHKSFVFSYKISWQNQQGSFSSAQSAELTH